MQLDIPDYETIDPEELLQAKATLLSQFRDSHPQFSRHERTIILMLAQPKDVVVSAGMRSDGARFLDMPAVNAPRGHAPTNERIQDVWIPRRELNRLPTEQASVLATAGFSWRMQLLHEQYANCIADGCKNIGEVQRQMEVLEQSYARRIAYIFKNVPKQ